MFKPFRFIPDDTAIAFMRFARVGFYVSMVLCVLSIGLFLVAGLNYGIDFKGGTLIEIKTQGPADLGDLRSRVGGLGLGDTELQEFGEPDDVLIRIATQPGGDEAQQAAVDKVKAVLGPGIDYRRVEVVGPKVSGELAFDGTVAVVVAIIGVLIYIWFRFEWQFALGAVATLIHDVVLTIGLFALLRIGFDLSIIAAILTIVGYSLNDTVVVFDRFRENLRRYKQKPLAEIIDLSLNQTLPRTIMTSMSTMIALLALYIFGGEVIRGFTFAMIWGVLVGTYSSIFIGAPVLIFLGARIGSAASEAKAEAVKARP
jgi:preprotein translocase subunit SecF